jgi:hypothetical protein
MQDAKKITEEYLKVNKLSLEEMKANTRNQIRKTSNSDLNEEEEIWTYEDNIHSSIETFLTEQNYHYCKIGQLWYKVQCKGTCGKKLLRLQKGSR